MNDYEERTLKAFAEIVLNAFGGSMGVIAEALIDFTTEEVQVLSETEELLLAWEAEAGLAPD